MADTEIKHPTTESECGELSDAEFFTSSCDLCSARSFCLLEH